jgi:hypothetical protein
VSAPTQRGSGRAPRRSAAELPADEVMAIVAEGGGAAEGAVTRPRRTARTSRTRTKADAEATQAAAEGDEPAAS